MNYGDEIDNIEESNYAKEMYGRSSDQSHDEEAEEEGEQEIVPLAREFTKRENRGRRMHALVGKAQEEDDAFWGGVGADFFGEGESSEDKDFKTSDEAISAAQDSFDSDFGQSSEEIGSEAAKRQKLEEDYQGEEEDKMLALQERKEKNKKKV